MKKTVPKFQEMAMANVWSEMATLLHIRTHLKDYARECGSYATLEEVFEALRAKYGLTVREARTRLTSLKRDARLSNTPCHRGEEASRSSLRRSTTDTQTGNDTRPVV